MDYLRIVQGSVDELIALKEAQAIFLTELRAKVEESVRMRNGLGVGVDASICRLTCFVVLVEAWCAERKDWRGDLGTA